jgi:hypothetical protein
MNKIKFTVRVEPATLETAKQYAGEHRTTITNLVEEYFRSLGKVKEIQPSTPILNELIGTLNADASLDDYHAYLEKKFLGDTG